MTHTLHLSHFCCSSCSAKCRQRKRSERKCSPIYFFCLPMFSSFVSLPPSNVNNAQHLVCLFFPPISFSGVEKADFRSFPGFTGSSVVLTKYGSLTRGNSVSSNSTPCFYTPPFGRGEKGFFPGSHQKINGDKNKRENCTRLLVLLEDWTEPAERTQVVSLNCGISCKGASAKQGFRSDAASDDLESGICLGTLYCLGGNSFLPWLRSTLFHSWCIYLFLASSSGSVV